MTQKMAAEVTACEHAAFNDFVATIEALRAPDGCPWDREQTHRSIAHNMIEEAYEAVDAIECGDMAHLREELGDVLLQVVLQCQIAADEGLFTIDDVCAEVNEKMIRRHPHVFGQVKVENANEVLDLWDQVKLAEQGAASSDAQSAAGGDAQSAADDASTQDAAKGAARQEPSSPKGLLDGVPKSFPALMQAQKISRKAAAAGFEWDTVDDVWEKVAEEISELKAAYAAAAKTPDGKVLKEADERAAQAVELEAGDVLFAFVNVTRKMGVSAENALRAACAKFRTRWSFIEGAAWGMGKNAADLSMDELEELWQVSKMLEASASGAENALAQPTSASEQPASGSAFAERADV